ncbi:universal stress protein [Thalassotalea fusca]
MNKLLVVADKVGESSVALKQALILADTYQAQIHVVQFVYEDLRDVSNDHDEIRNTIIDRLSTQLEQELAHTISGQVEYTYEVVWLKKIHQWIIDYTQEHKPSMVLKTGHRTESTFYTPTDWLLIRECTAPVLIVAETKWRKSPNVFAAIDLGTKLEDKQALNKKILTHAKQLAQSYSVDLHVCYAPPVSPLLRDLGLQYADEVEENAIRDTKAAIESLSQEFDIPKKNFSIHAGDPAKVIPSMAAEANAGLVVIGTVGRTGLSGKFIGNTAEKIMMLLKTDVLALKP